MEGNSVRLRLQSAQSRSTIASLLCSPFRQQHWLLGETHQIKHLCAKTEFMQPSGSSFSTMPCMASTAACSHMTRLAVVRRTPCSVMSEILGQISGVSRATRTKERLLYFGVLGVLWTRLPHRRSFTDRPCSLHLPQPRSGRSC